MGTSIAPHPGRVGDPGLPVFTSDNLTSGYTYAGRSWVEYAPERYIFEDQSVAAMDSGTAYSVWTAWNLTRAMTTGALGSIMPILFQTLFIQQLTDDYMNGTGKSHPIVAGSFPVPYYGEDNMDAHIEAPDMFQRGDLYYVLGSTACDHCNALDSCLPVNIVNGSLDTPDRGYPVYMRRSNDGSDEAARGCVMLFCLKPRPKKFILTIGCIEKPSSTSTYVLQANIVAAAPAPLNSISTSGYAMWPLNFNNDGSIKPIDCANEVEYKIRAPRGTVDIPETGLAKDATDGSDNYATYKPATDFPASSFFPTWQSSKSGNLTNIGVALAVNGANSNMTVIVFRQANVTALTLPYYTWEELTTVTLTPSDISSSFDAKLIAYSISGGGLMGIHTLSAFLRIRS
ncbi:hypothetical protein BDW74DRAFT_181777 [Aspergillus multicolor]|uniref:uncharacterized protein n=1 Tax=Aspergillus multicolor TaxID=41759 RepID=UPI003CCDDA3E